VTLSLLNKKESLILTLLQLGSQKFGHDNNTSKKPADATSKKQPSSRAAMVMETSLSSWIDRLRKRRISEEFVMGPGPLFRPAAGGNTAPEAGWDSVAGRYKVGWVVTVAGRCAKVFVAAVSKTAKCSLSDAKDEVNPLRAATAKSVTWTRL
jgi:hypothetical protein